MEGIPTLTERFSAMSENLKTVEVKCEVVDDKVQDVLKFLSNKLGIRKLLRHHSLTSYCLICFYMCENR
jgi:hypothetical protein